MHCPHPKTQPTFCPRSVHGPIRVFEFQRDALDRAGVASPAFGGGGGSPSPFLVIASNDINDELHSQEPPVFWPERRYPWGTAEAFNPDHSDLLFLR